MRRLLPVTALVVAMCSMSSTKAEAPKKLTRIETILQATEPLKFPRGDRLPLYIWASKFSGVKDEAEIEKTLKQLDARGIAVFCPWSAGANIDKCLEHCLTVGKLQKKLGLMVNVDATSAVYSFCDGSEETAHLADDDTKFFDMSFASYRKMGCPFAMQGRYEPMRQQLEPFLKAYQENGVPLDFWTADWEIDGAIEWNEAWANSKRCKRCRENIPDLENFSAFQKALRKIRCDMQNEVFCKTIKKYFPDALIGNYGTNPHDGWRYWYDYFEKDVDGAPVRREQNAIYRPWADDFKATGYTSAMPVVYTWYRIYNDYTFKDQEYRWFYNMLLVATNTAANTPASTPIIPFVHWTTTTPPKEFPEGFVPMSEGNYKELLWHLLLRGHDTFCMWCGGKELDQETRPLHQVYAASLEYKDFLDQGEPVTFKVPNKPGPVVSGLLLGNRLLVRRTDFGRARRSVKIEVRGQKIKIPRSEGACQILTLQ